MFYPSRLVTVCMMFVLGERECSILEAGNSLYDVCAWREGVFYPGGW